MLASAPGCDPLHADLSGEPPHFSSAPGALPGAPPRGTIKVLDWNIKFGGARIDFFFDCFGDRVLMREAEVRENLANVAAAIRHFAPDVVLLQEVDLNSKRSAFVDELAYLVQHTALPYGVYASAWKADFIPSDGIGPVDSGNAILSRWPLRDARRIALARSQDQSKVERYFYLRRNILVATTEVPGGPALTIANVHTDAYGKDGTKLRHIERFIEELEQLDEAGQRFVAGGDLNTVPPSSTKLFGFDDTVCTDESYVADDYREDVGVLDPLYERYEPAITTERYTRDQAAFFSHTVDGRGFWNRTLDYLFTNGDFVDGSGIVHQDASKGGIDTMPLSDHAPLSVELVWP